MPIMVLGLVLAALVILAVVLSSPHRRGRVTRDEGTPYVGDGGWNPAFVSGDGGSSDCGASDAGGGCDGGGGGGGD